MAGGTFSDGQVRGHIVSDVLDLGGSVRARVRVGVADDVPLWTNIQHSAVDAFIGLSASASDTKTGAVSNVSVLPQLLAADALQPAPIITIYLNQLVSQFSAFSHKKAENFLLEKSLKPSYIDFLRVNVGKLSL